jgi:hypothetical protein
LSLLQILLAFVALNPTYILPVVLPNAKPNNGQSRNRAIEVSFSIRLDARGQRQRSDGFSVAAYNLRHFEKIEGLKIET